MTVLRYKPLASTVTPWNARTPLKPRRVTASSSPVSSRDRCLALRCRNAPQESEEASTSGAGSTTDTNDPVPVQLDIDKEVTRFARNAATTFAPRASGATKNPAYKGSLLYTVFEVQAWVALFVGGLLSFNVIFPSDQPDIARLIGMWSIWMFTVPSLRARDCSTPEKDALNTLFLAIPVLNVALPFVWKSFPFIFSADCLLLAAVYLWKGVIPIPIGKEDGGR